MSKFWGTLVGLGAGLAIGGCNPTVAAHDGGPLRDTAPALYDAGPPGMDSGTLGMGTAYVRLVNLIPASPNLTVCIAPIPGTGVAPTSAHIIGSPDARLMSDGTLPYPAVSPYLPALLFDTPGFGYELRLYNHRDVPFAALGVCPEEGASPAPIATARFTTSDVTDGNHYSLAFIGVLPGTPVQCPGTCPPIQTRLFLDNLAPPTANLVRTRLFQSVPNLPYPIHVCFDLDYTTSGDGPAPPQRILPPLADTDGLAFGEVTPFVNLPPVTTAGAFYSHATVAGVPDCDLSTRVLGPITVPLPIPTSAPREVARVFIGHDVITNFAFGRAGAMCTTAADCVAPTSVCVSAACTCDATHHCVDDLAPNLLPWRDFQADLPVDAGTTADAGM